MLRRGFYFLSSMIRHLELLERINLRLAFCRDLLELLPSGRLAPAEVVVWRPAVPPPVPPFCAFDIFSWAARIWIADFLCEKRRRELRERRLAENPRAIGQGNGSQIGDRALHFFDRGGGGGRGGHRGKIRSSWPAHFRRGIIGWRNRGLRGRGLIGVQRDGPGGAVKHKSSGPESHRKANGRQKHRPGVYLPG